MSFIPFWEKIIETKKCHISGQEFFVTDKDLAFYEKISPVFAGQKYLIPSPTLCPDERTRRRLSWRNERKLYHGKCAKTGNQIISIYSHDKEYIIYDPKIWWGEGWDPHEFRATFDFSRPFFEQFDELMKRTPKPALANGFWENSDYCNQCYYLKNCYLCFCTDYSEDSEYLHGSFESKNCFDCLNVEKCEYCHECVGCAVCFNCQQCLDCRDCRDMYFSFDCSSCQDCFGCTNLRNKSYYFFNKSLSPEIYKKRLEEYKNSTREIQDPIKQKVKTFMKNALYRDTNNINCESCTGDFLHGCKNAYECFEGREILESKYLALVPAWVSHSYDVTGIKWSHNLEGVSIDGNNIAFSAFIYSGNADVWYSHYCVNSGHNLFGCSSLKKSHHCVLNTPYSTQEYEKLCGKIIDHMRSTEEWGEFFPTAISPFGYDETVAMEHFPQAENDTQKNGWKWKGEEETSSYHGPYYTPLSIDQYDERKVGYATAQKNIDEVIAGILPCEISWKPFKIIKQELVFYIEHSIPLPTKHPDQRHKERMDLRNPRRLFERTCRECHKNIITTYSPDRPERVVCEECYRKIVF